MASVADERIVVRRTLRDGDAQAIVDLHERVYGSEYGMGERFLVSVADTIELAIAQGWPSNGGAVWLIDDAERVSGSLALTVEGDGTGRVRWFVFEPALRGTGLGRALIADLLVEARTAGLRKLELDTFSELTTAAYIYRANGFRVTSSRMTDRWGPTINYQHYELDLK